MSSRMSINDEIREQQQKTKDMTVKGKLSYFWYYYKLHTIAAILVIVFIAGFIQSYVTRKEYGFYATLINAVSYDVNSKTADTWAEEFQEFAGIDPDEYQTCIDTSVILSADTGSTYASANREKMVAMMQVGELNAIISDTETFESYAQVECFYDLESLFTAEELAPYRNLLYYTDAASFDREDGDTSGNDLNIDHTDPASMIDPVAVGICIPMENNKLSDAGYYTYLSDNNTTFQGHPSQVILGIPITNQEPRLALKFLEYLGVSS